MAIEVSKAAAPAHWASYLINGDASSFDYSNTPNDKIGDQDKTSCDKWIASLATDGWSVVSTEDDEEPHFAHSNDAKTLPCDVLTYILHRHFEIPAVDSEVALRNVRVDEHRLFVWDMLKQDSLGKTLLGYALYAPSDDTTPIFVGCDFACSPAQAIDSDKALRSLLTFLTLRPGDTDADYFADYTPKQIEWRDEHAEVLSLYAMDAEPGEAPYAFVDIV